MKPVLGKSDAIFHSPLTGGGSPLSTQGDIGAMYRNRETLGLVARAQVHTQSSTLSEPT